MLHSTHIFTVEIHKNKTNLVKRKHQFKPKHLLNMCHILLNN